ncbi:unnamed protein product [Lactuca saligna]|uniref:Uncharacterized protein n=1 Tax=Lactuca saligna TaxID=75948 RepID=A0AA35ZV80_LACSI|nr:unnamed protein product [Lactuca saligna]
MRTLQGSRYEDICDQSETDDYEGFLDIGFMQQVVVSTTPLNVIYPGSCFEGKFAQEVPQGTNSDIDSDDGVQLNPQKRKASFLGELLTLNLEVPIQLVILQHLL